MTEEKHEAVSSSVAVQTRDAHHNDNGTATVSTDSPEQTPVEFQIYLTGQQIEDQYL